MRVLIGNRGLLLVARLILSAVFLTAALPKLQDSAQFANDLAAYQIFGSRTSAWLVLILPWTELVCAIGLLTPWTRRACGILLSMLLISFIGLHLSAWTRGLEITCGCFGSGTESNYLWLFTRNLLLLLTSAWILRRDFRTTSPSFKD